MPAVAVSMEYSVFTPNTVVSAVLETTQFAHGARMVVSRVPAE